MACCVAACLVMGSAAKAQTDRGTLLLGGNVSFQTSDAQNVFMFNPQLGTFILRNIALGAAFSYRSATGTSSTWAVGPFVRPYFGAGDGKFFLQGQMLIGGGDGLDTKFGWGGGLGYAHFLNSSVALEVTSMYSKIGDMKGVFALGAGFQIHLQ